MRAMSATWLRVSSGSLGAVLAIAVVQPAGRSAAASTESPMRPRPSVSNTLRTSRMPMFCAAIVASTVVESVAFGSACGRIATGWVYMKPTGGAATMRKVCLAGSNM